MSIREKFVFILLLIFFIHGCIYLFFPEQIYTSFWAKYIKYVVFVLYFIVTIKFINWEKFFLVMGIIFSFISLACLSHADVPQAAFQGHLNFFLPFVLLANEYEIPSKVMKKSVVIVTWVALFFSFVEYVFLKEFMIFNNHLNAEGFYRIISIFISSNGAALMFSLFVIYIVTYSKSLNLGLSLLILLCVIAIIFTGSKSPLMLFVLFYGFKYCIPIFLYLKIKRKLFVQLFLCMLIAGIMGCVLTSESVLKLLSLRSYSLGTANVRLEEYVQFGEMVNQHFWAPEIDMIWGSSNITSDSTFLGLWGSFSFWGLILYLLLVVILLVLRSNVSVGKLSFVAAFLLSGFGMKLSFTWPFSYIFFYILAINSVEHTGVVFPEKRKFNNVYKFEKASC